MTGSLTLPAVPLLDLLGPRLLLEPLLLCVLRPELGAMGGVGGVFLGACHRRRGIRLGLGGFVADAS